MAKDEREARLPKWAQDEMARLRMRLRDAEDRCSALYGSEPTETMGLLGLNTDYPLPAGASVRFGCTQRTMPNGTTFTDYVFEARRNKDGSLEVSAREGRLLTRAQSTNRLDVLSEDLFGRDR